MKPTEFEIIRAVSIRLDADTALVMSYQYHTEKDPADPQGKKNDRAKSRYRMMGRVVKIRDAETEANRLHEDQNRLSPWKWPDDPSWDGSILYMKDATNAAAANWLRLKVRKLVEWDVGMKILAGYKKDMTLDKAKTKKLGAGAYTVFCPNAVYDTEGYACSDGSTVSLTDRETLLSKVGQNVWKEIRMKLVGPENAKRDEDERAENAA